MNSNKESFDLNSRFLQSISYFIEWAKHIITISSAIMLLSATFLKDIVNRTDPHIRLLVIIFLAGAYFCLLLSVWKALEFITHAASTIFTTNKDIGSPEELRQLKNLLRIAQFSFLFGLVCFSILALFSLLSWALS